MRAIEGPGQGTVMEVKTCLRDTRYALVRFGAKGKGYVFLYDADQHSLFLGQETQTIDLIALWQRHRWDKAYCLPCDPMLRFEKRWGEVPGYPSVELGIDTSTARVLTQALRARSPCFERLVGGIIDAERRRHGRGANDHPRVPDGRR